MSAAQVKKTEESPRKKPDGMVKCPFTGVAVELRCVGKDGDWMGVGPFWSTKLFPSKQELVNSLMTRNGNPPPWAGKVPTVTESRDKKEGSLEEAMEGLTKPV